MKDLGSRYDFHMHTIFSDGALLPAALVREAEIKGCSTIAITDHVDASNLEDTIRTITKFINEMRDKLPIRVLPGAEISYIQPPYIEEYSKRARSLGAKIIIVHGESPVESVYPKTNLAAVKLEGIVDILAHPGEITDEEVKLAAKNKVFLELSGKSGHKKGNRHVAKLSKKYGAKMLVNTDTHSEKDIITQKEAFNIAKDAGLSEKEALVVVKDNPQELINRHI